jgi:hypothetical protein
MAEVIDIQVDLTGITDIEVKVKSIIKMTEHNVKKALLAFGYNVQADAIETIQQRSRNDSTRPRAYR